MFCGVIAYMYMYMYTKGGVESKESEVKDSGSSLARSRQDLTTALDAALGMYIYIDIFGLIQRGYWVIQRVSVITLLILITLITLITLGEVDVFQAELLGELLTLCHQGLLERKAGRGPEEIFKHLLSDNEWACKVCFFFLIRRFYS